MTRIKTVATRALAIATRATSRTALVATTGAATETVVAQSNGPQATPAIARPTAMTSPRSKSVGR